MHKATLSIQTVEQTNINTFSESERIKHNLK